ALTQLAFLQIGMIHLLVADQPPVFRFTHEQVPLPGIGRTHSKGEDTRRKDRAQAGRAAPARQASAQSWSPKRMSLPCLFLRNVASRSSATIASRGRLNGPRRRECTSQPGSPPSLSGGI